MLPPKLLLNGKYFNWRLFKAGGEGQLQAKREADEYVAALKRNNGVLPQMDEELEEDSHYVSDDELASRHRSIVS